MKCGAAVLIRLYLIKNVCKKLDKYHLESKLACGGLNEWSVYSMHMCEQTTKDCEFLSVLQPVCTPWSLLPWSREAFHLFSYYFAQKMFREPCFSKTYFCFLMSMMPFFLFPSLSTGFNLRWKKKKESLRRFNVRFTNPLDALLKKKQTWKLTWTLT